MRLFCAVVMETAELESTKVPTKTWRKKRGQKAMEENTEGSRDERDGNVTEPERSNVVDGACKNVHGASGAVLVNVGCPSQIDTVQGAVDIVLCMDDIQEPNKEELLADFISEDAGLLCKAEEGHESGDPSPGAGAGRRGLDGANVVVFRKFGRAERR